MIYAQFYHSSTPSQWNNYTSKPIEACGDRAVIILDGRHSLETNSQIANDECRKRGYLGFHIAKGESFNRSTVIQPYRSATV